MNKNYKPSNNSYREHFHIHRCLSPIMIEELLNKVDDLERNHADLGHDFDLANQEAVYWQNKYESIA